MELRNIYSFLKVVEKNSFSKAAEELGYNQSSITVQIKNLEEGFGVKFFDRIGKKIYLTPKGEEFYEYCLAITRLVEDATYAISQDETMHGVLRIGCIESIENSFLRKLLLQYHQEFPHIQIHIQTGTSTKLLDLLKNNRVDVICTLDHALYSNEWIKYSNKKEPIVFVGSSEERYPVLTVDNITQYPFLLTEKGESYRYILEDVLAERDLIIDPILETGNTGSIKKYIMNSMGIGFLPYYTIEEEIKNRSLQIVRSSFCQIAMWLQVIYHKSKTITGPIHGFLKIYDTWDSQRTDWEGDLFHKEGGRSQAVASRG